MNIRAIIVFLSFTGLATLFLHTTASDAKQGFCFSKITKKGGCRSLKGRRVTLRECCLNISGIGWSPNRKDRLSCETCQSWLKSSKWSDWTSYSACPVTCGIGVMTRTRTCRKKYVDGPNCQGEALDTKRCPAKQIHCPIDGGWSNWTRWSDCSKTCGQGVEIRKRTCSDPVPKYGGKMCEGRINEIRNCTLRQHCPIDGGWGPWGPWSQCSKTCNIGKQTRKRSCDNPAPQHGGRPCPKSRAVDEGFCRIHKCAAVDASGEGSGEGSGVASESSGFVASSGSGSRASSGSGGWSSIRKKREVGIADDEDY